MIDFIDSSFYLQAGCSSYRLNFLSIDTKQWNVNVNLLL